MNVMSTTSSTIAAPKLAAKDRPTFTITLRPEPGVDPVLALRALLKMTLRRFGMRCISAHEDGGEQ
jgi:hypothetical protein